MTHTYYGSGSLASAVQFAVQYPGTFAEWAGNEADYRLGLRPHNGDGAFWWCVQIRHRGEVERVDVAGWAELVAGHCLRGVGRIPEVTREADSDGWLVFGKPCSIVEMRAAEKAGEVVA